MKQMKLSFFMIIVFLIFISNLSLTQTIDDYRVELKTKMLEPLQGETTTIFGPGVFWQISPEIDLPFAFNYCGTDYNKIKVSSNGFLTFDVSTSSHYLYNDLGGWSPKNVLAPLWDWLTVRSAGKIHYQTIGTSPNRIFVVEFYQVVWGGHYSPEIDFQILLFEGSNDIEFHYGSEADAGTAADGASIGINDNQRNFINALDGSRDVAQNDITTIPNTNFRFTTSPPPANDVGVTGIEVASSWFVNSADEISIVVENYGTEAQSWFKVAYQVENDDPVFEIFNTTIEPGKKEIMTFITSWEPETSGLFSIRAWSDLSGDANSANDSTFAKDGITVFEIEFPPPQDVQLLSNEQNENIINWLPGVFEKPLPGEWNGTTNEDQTVHMIVNYNSSDVDSCTIYFLLNGETFVYPMEPYNERPIVDNKFSFYKQDQYGRMNTDVEGTFFPPDSCAGTWSTAVYINNVYTVFSGTWSAKSELEAPVAIGFQVYRNENPDVAPIEENLIATITDTDVTSYTDAQVTAESNYYVVVQNYDRGNSLPSMEVTNVSGVNNYAVTLPQKYKLYPAYPNPFNPQTTLQYDLPVAGQVELKVYNILGETVANLVNEWQAAGNYKIMFEAGHLSSGLYFISIKAGSYHYVNRVTLLR